MESPDHVSTTETASTFWTEEKHLRFLNSMEASFVTAMLENNARLLRLDRHLPDTSESTLDLNPHRSTRRHAPSDLMGARGRVEGRRLRRRTSQPYNSSQDQVVP